ncbi:MAG: alpha/beta fold hydrolase, partial [Ktedonobacterales bacterium]
DDERGASDISPRARHRAGRSTMAHPTLPPGDLVVHVVGEGEPILLVHGTGSDGDGTWARQRSLASQFQLRMVDRRGCGDSPDRPPEYGFAEEAREIAALLGDGAHLVGQSYGGVIALLAAQLRPEAVYSLTVSEPPAFGVARDHPDAAWLIDRLAPLFMEAPHLTPEEYDVRFDSLLGFPPVSAPSLTTRQRKNLNAGRLEHAPWTAPIDLDQLAAAPFRTLVISGGWDAPGELPHQRAGRAFTAVCDVIGQRLGSERAVVSGAFHAIPATGQPYNDRLSSFLTSVSRA